MCLKIPVQNVRWSVSIYVQDCPWLNSLWEKADIGQYIDENVSTNEIWSWFETDQSQKFAVLCVLWALPSQLNPRVSFVNHWGYI